MSEKKYYWAKLKEDFYVSNEAKIIKREKNGFMVLCLFQELILLSVNTEGWFITKAGDVCLPWTPESLSKELLGYSAKRIRDGINLLLRVGLIYEYDDVLRISNFDKYVGYDTKGAARMRKCRKKKEEEREKLHEQSNEKSEDEQEELPEASNEEERMKSSKQSNEKSEEKQEERLETISEEEHSYSSLEANEARANDYLDEAGNDHNSPIGAGNDHNSPIGAGNVTVQGYSSEKYENNNKIMQSYSDSNLGNPNEGEFFSYEVRSEYIKIKQEIWDFTCESGLKLVKRKGITSYYNTKICERILSLSREIARHENYIINSSLISSLELLVAMRRLVTIDGKRLLDTFHKLDELLKTTEVKDVFLYTITFLYNESTKKDTKNH